MADSRSDPPTHVLLVEDNPGDQLLIREMLVDAGLSDRVELTIAGRLDDGLVAARNATPDVVLLDLHLPDTSGSDTLTRWRAAMPDLPVVVLTGLDDGETGQRAIAAGAQDYLAKGGLDGQLLFRVSRYAMERHRLARQLELERADLADRVESRTVQLREANQELADALAAKDRFLANMTHELRTPMASVLMLSEALQDEVYGPLNDKQMRCVTTVRDSGEHLLSLINDMLDLARLNAGRMELQIAQVPVGRVMAKACDLVRTAADTRPVSLEWSVTDGTTTVTADEKRLVQILVNLLSNAIKFTPPGGQVRLTASQTPEAIEMAVSDSGIGIAYDDIANRLFRPFTQVSDTLDRPYEGSGLGLTLVKQFTELHGGSVQVESAPGKGSTFRVRLPRSHDVPLVEDWNWTSSGASEHSQSGSSSRDRELLLVEDNAVNREALVEYLTTIGYRVDTAVDSGQALEKALNRQYRLILMDMQMPGLDGLEVTRRIKSDPDRAGTPVVAMAAMAITGGRERCLAAGADDYLARPISLKHLRTVIEHHAGDVAADN